MKKFLIAGSSLAAVAAAGSAGAVDVTLGGSINMGVEFGLGKNANDLAFSDAFNEVSLSIAAAHTTDGGLSFGGAFTMGTAASIEFAPYADAAGDKFLAKRTVDGRTNIAANLWNVSGGGAVASANVVSVKINSDWLGIDQQQVEYTLALGSFTSSNICKLAGRGTTVGASIPLRAWAVRRPRCWWHLVLQAWTADTCLLVSSQRPIRQCSRLQTLRPQPFFLCRLVPTVKACQPPEALSLRFLTATVSTLLLLLRLRAELP